MKTFPQALALAGVLLTSTAPGALGGGCSSSARDAHRAATSDIVDTAVAAGSFQTLVAAVQAAGLVDTLKGDGPFTVFAPTDEAFAALPAGTVESLLADPDALREVLTYHVVAGRLTSDDVARQRRARTVQGTRVRFRDGRVDDANIVTADIQTSNGIIHVIDAVILPEQRVGR